MEDILPNPWNPNKMSDETFNRLVENMDEIDYIEPIQVVPIEDGKYQIIGGEHRWRAQRVRGVEELECVVLGDEMWKEVDLRKFVTMRMNAIKGKVDPQKFMDLYVDLSERYEEEALQALMGVVDQSEWTTLTKDVRKGLVDAGLGKKQLEKFDEVTKNLKSVDDLSAILNKLFSENGDTMEFNFMVFGFGGHEHLYVQLDKPSWKSVKKMIDVIEKQKGDAAKSFGALADSWVAAQKVAKENPADVVVDVTEATGESGGGT